MTALSLGVLLLLPTSSQATDESELMQQWIALESQKGKLQSHWERQKSRLENKRKLLVAQEKQLTALLNEAKTNKSNVDQARLVLVQEQIEFERQDKVIKQTISESYSFLASVLPQLPPPVQAEWEGKLNLLNDENIGNNEKLERYVSLLQNAYKFNQRIVYQESPLTINTAQGEQLINVHQIYLGLNQAWYVSEDKQYYGYGKAIEGSWQWLHNNEAEAYLNQPIDTNNLIAIKNTLNNPTTASYISAPITLSKNKGLL